MKKSERDYDDLLVRYTDRFGFYTFEKDRELLEYFVLADKPVIELDQVFASSDVPLLDELSKSTTNEKAKAVYQELMDIAEIRWSAYKNDPNVQPPFDLNGLPLLFSEELSTKLQRAFCLKRFRQKSDKLYKISCRATQSTLRPSLEEVCNPMK